MKKNFTTKYASHTQHISENALIISRNLLGFKVNQLHTLPTLGHTVGNNNGIDGKMN
ncbi:MAG: hypothetical protein ACTS8R_09370 [Arsenophonus sp. NC-QC1-MAG3]